MLTTRWIYRMFSVRNAICLAVLLTCGCSTPTSPDRQSQDAPTNDSVATIKVNGPLRVTVLDDPAFSEFLQREWVAYSDYEIAIHNDTEAAFLGNLRQDPEALAADVVIFPSRLLGELAENGRLRALPPTLTSTSTGPSDSGYQIGDVWKAVSRKEMMWDRRQIAVSLGSPVPLLVVRDDLVEQPPQTWAELASFVREQRDQLPEGVVPVAEPLADGWAARMFLSRSACYMYEASRVSQFFDYTNMKPRIASAPGERALTEMLAGYDPSNDSLDAQSAYQKLLTSEAAMALTWPHAISLEESPTFPISIHELPGSLEEYNSRKQDWQDLTETEGLRRMVVLGHEGRLGAICRNGKNFSLAGVFLGWLSNSENGIRVCARSRSSAPFRRSHRNQAQAWCGNSLPPQTAARYGECLEASLGRTEVFLGLRLPGQDRYLEALDAEIMRALHGEATPREALLRASEAWEAITDSLGREKQVAAYRHSLGIDIE